ncbi:MAG: ISL3 family transposase [Planctomycetes bacterium]|nr:ISL3 family transposase [Planctomycetota bacterium]
MAVKQDYIDVMVSLQGFSVRMVGAVDESDGSKSLMIELRRKHGVYRCRCGREFTARYDSRERCVRDLSYGPYNRSYLMFWQARIDCPECGVVNEALDWVLPSVSYTKRLAAAVALSCREVRSIKSVAKQYDLHEHTVKAIDKAALEADLPDVSDLSPRLLGVDEFSIRRGHEYGTTVVDLEDMTVPYVAEGRTKDSLADFYKALGHEKCEVIEAVAMDMWRPYKEATKEYCPNAEIVYDPFHIIAAYGREVIDKVRMQEFRRANDEEKKFIKGSKYLLLKNRGNLDRGRDEPARLKDLLRFNRVLSVVYLLKDDLKQLWKYRRASWALKWLDSWYKRAIYSKIEPLKKFAKMLKAHKTGIISHCWYRIHTGFLEGVNNKIKVIKRVAYGFGDMEYFFLKIRGAFNKG